MLVLAQAYLHQLDPFAIEFPESWQRLAFVPDGLRWYGLSYFAAFVLAWVMIRWMARTGRIRLTAEAVLDLMFYVMAGVLLGGRLGYVLFYHPEYLIEFSAQFPWWEVLAVNRGGMASHGGMIGVILAVCLFARRHKISSLHLLDVGAFATPLGMGIGRLANFVNAELWGRPLPDSMQANPPWWAIKYPQEPAENWLIDDPERLNTLTDAVGKIEFSSLEWAGHVADSSANDGVIRNILHQLVLKVQDGSQPVMDAMRGHLTAYYPSQLFQALADGLMVMLVLAFIWLKPRKPGIVGAWYLISYGALRILTEAFRQHDVGVEPLFGIITRGQQLSILMIVSGIVGLLIVMRRDVERLGGLAHPGKPPAPPAKPTKSPSD